MKEMNTRQIRDYVADVKTFVDSIYEDATDEYNAEYTEHIGITAEYLGYALAAIYTAWVGQDEADLWHNVDLWFNAQKRADARWLKLCKSHKLCPKDLYTTQLRAMYERICELGINNEGIDKYMPELIELIDTYNEYKGTIVDIRFSLAQLAVCIQSGESRKDQLEHYKHLTKASDVVLGWRTSISDSVEEWVKEVKVALEDWRPHVNSGDKEYRQSVADVFYKLADEPLNV